MTTSESILIKYRERQRNIKDSLSSRSEFLDGEPGDTCVHWQTTAQHYLYDGGALLAIYDKNGTITHSYINGPGGPIVVYLNNSDATLYYFLKDHLGSTLQQ